MAEILTRCGRKELKCLNIMTVLLTTLNAKYIHTNLAIRLLYQLNKSYEGLAWREFTIKENPDDIASICASYHVVAFSCYIWNIRQTLIVCERIKSLNPSVKIILGGPEVSYEYEPIIIQPYVDAIVVGEGEIPFRNFLITGSEKQKGIVYKENNQINYIPNDTLFDLSELETINPYQDDDIESLKPRVLYVETSRGCPYKCEFCLASLDNKVRYLSTGRIKQNLLFLMQHGRTIKFLDRTFNVKKDFTIEVFKFILEHHSVGNIFQFEITADILHPDIITFIREHVKYGLFRFEIGIQTVNQTANLAVSRKQNFQKTAAVIQAVRPYIEMHLDLIVGLPFDYWDDIKHSIEEVFSLYPPELQLGFLKFLKGTPMRSKTAEHGYEYDAEAPYQIIRSHYLSNEELEKIETLEFALEVYWNKKRLVNTLMYISSKDGVFDFLLGLGTYFKQMKNTLVYTLLDIYDVAHQYIEKYYADDKVMIQLFALDYYLQYKIKPKVFVMQEPPKKEKFAWLDSQKLIHQQYRYVVLDIDFDWQYWMKSHQIKFNSQRVAIQYNGIQKAEMISIT